MVPGGDHAKDVGLKETLDKKRKRAEQKRAARLMRALDGGDEDGILENIYGSMQVRLLVVLH